MIDPKMELLSTVVAVAASRLMENPDDPSAWGEVRAAVAATGDEDPDLAEAVENEDAEKLMDLGKAWYLDQRVLPVSDRGVLKRAMKAYRKSLKVTILMDESRLGHNAMTTGHASGIIGIIPPPRYPRPVWDQLARQGRLIADHSGVYELPPGQ
jgi:hypothetical protein